MSARRPNVILLVSHDTGTHISPYGVETVNTPNFERLAESSVRFEVIDDNHPLFELPEHMEPRLAARDEDRPLFCQIGGFETHRGWEVFDTPPG